jgi:hypothetical protein
METLNAPFKWVVPLFFKETDRCKLLQSNSVLRHLMYEWKEDSVTRQNEEHTRTLELVRASLQILRFATTTALQTAAKNFSLKVEHVCRPGVDENIRHHLNVLDNEVMVMTLRFYAILEETKRLATLRHQFVAQAIELKSELDRLVKRFKEFSAFVEFETWGSAKLAYIEASSPQFESCASAVQDNSLPELFENSSYSRLKLRAAFKIENPALQSDFQKRFSSTSMLRGAFVSVTKKQVAGVVLLGFREQTDFVESSRSLFQRKLLRIPAKLKHKSRVESFLANSEGFTSPLTLSSASTLKKDKRRLKADDNCVIVLFLCRALIPRDSAKEQEIKDFQNVLPEYLLLCTKERTVFPLKQTAVFPVQLLEQSEVDTPEDFYSAVSKAVDQSQAVRNSLRNEFRELIDNYRRRLQPRQPVGLLQSFSVAVSALRAQRQELAAALARH